MANSRSGESVVERINKLLSAFERHKPRYTISALARETGIPSSTTHRLVADLCAVGFLDRNENGLVGIGPRMWELASRSNDLEEFRRRGRPVLEGIEEAVKEDVSLSVPSFEDFTVLYLERLNEHGPERNLAEVAGRLEMHSTSPGMAMLAFAPQDVQEEFLRGDISKCTPRTETDPARLRARFAEIRQRGFARLAGDLVEENVGYAVPVRGRQNKVLGALSVVTSRDVDKRQIIVPVLAAAGRSLSRLMGSDDRRYSARQWSSLRP